MLKWSLTLNALFLSLVISSCITSPDAPKLPREPRQFIYADEPDKWCRLNGDAVECVDDLRKIACYPIDDVKMIQIYIVELNEKCEKWSTNGL